MSEPLSPGESCVSPTEGVMEDVERKDEDTTDTEKREVWDKSPLSDVIDWNFLGSALGEKESDSLDKDAQEGSSEKAGSLLDELLNEEVTELEEKTDSPREISIRDEEKAVEKESAEDEKVPQDILEDFEKDSLSDNLVDDEESLKEKPSPENKKDSLSEDLVDDEESLKEKLSPEKEEISQESSLPEEESVSNEDTAEEKILPESTESERREDNEEINLEVNKEAVENVEMVLDDEEFAEEISELLAEEEKDKSVRENVEKDNEMEEELQEMVKETSGNDDISQESLKDMEETEEKQETIENVSEEKSSTPPTTPHAPEKESEIIEESQESLKETTEDRENQNGVEKIDKDMEKDKKPPPDDEQVVLIEEDEPEEEDKTTPEKKSPEVPLESREESEESKEATQDDDVIEIPEDEPQKEEQSKEEVSVEPAKPTSVTEENSSMSMDLIESCDVPSERADTVEDDSTPMDMEVDETANAEWPVNHLNTGEKDDKSKHFECINVACKSQNGEQYAPAQGYIVSFYSTKKRKKTQYVCQPCHEVAMRKMMEYCNVLNTHKPIFHHFPQHTEVVEISDSSEDSSPEDEMVQVMRRPLSESERNLIEQNLDNIIIATMERVKINQQFEWTKNDLEKRMTKVEKSHSELNAEFQKIQRMADGMFKNLNSREKRTTQNEPPIHIYTEFPALDDENSQVNYRMIKEKGPTTYTPAPSIAQAPAPVTTVAHSSEVKKGQIYYGMRTQLTKPWTHCEVIDKLQARVDTETRYQVKFLRHQQEGILSGKQLAFTEAATQKLPVGSRVLAMFSNARRKLFYPGIVAEPTQETNKFRYLVFFDDGYVQYVCPSDVRRICQVSENVWEDVNPGCREFIKNYLQENQYQRAVAQVKIGQKIEVERNGKWVSMRVAKVDCSLILVYFAEYTEWIYSGSQRLLPIYRMKMDSRLSTGKKLQTRNEPYVTFGNADDDSQRATEQQELEDARVNRSVAKKSTQPTPAPVVQQKQLMNNSTIFLEDDNYPKGKVVFYTAKFNMPPKSYTPHMCNAKCLYRISYDLNLYNPLAKPLLSGWERKIYRVKARRYVIYKAPCGRSLRGIEEVHSYLRLTDCNLNVDNYDFDPSVHCLAEYVIDSAIVRKSDISNAVETMPIACVNCYDDTVPPSCIYANHRIPTDGVHLNLDPEFLVGCDCTDDCMDKSKCSCWQLTLAGVRCFTPNVDSNAVGYSYKKLYDPVPTGIYECNSRCKCRMNCLNRVVQHPLSLKLQVFKTANRGWGLRCLNDVPKGQFICIYAGHLLTEQKANEGGQNHGDEYFAELDYIEVAEGIKEGYEPEAAEDDSASDRDDDEYNPKRRRGSDSDDDYFSLSTAVMQKTIKTRSRTRGSDVVPQSKPLAEAVKAKEGNGNANEDVIAISDDEDERVPQSFEPNISIEKEDMPSKKTRGLRRMFGKGEDVYVMDAKIMGNVGRYFNHSCAPNLFVQNVFVDTHDLRFPWVSFFAMCHIRAGTELTWNYNYDVGTVPGKFLFCQCGSKNCRGRIL